MYQMTFLSPKKLEAAVDKHLLELMAPQGFVVGDPGGIERWQGDRYDYIACVINKVGGVTRISPFGQMGFRHVQRIYSHFMSDDPEASNNIAVDMQLRYAHFMKDWTADMRCEQVEHLGSFLNDLTIFVRDKLYPALMSYASPEIVLETYLRKDEGNRTSFNPPSWSGASSALTGLILARLHGPKHYLSLKKRYAVQFSDLDGDRLERTQRLIAYLDGPDPLPSLSSAP